MSGIEKANATRAEFFRAASALAKKHKGGERLKVIALFTKHWPEVYPDIPLPLDANGLPVDFSDDSRFKPVRKGNSEAALPRSDMDEELDKNDTTPLDPAASLFTPPPPISLDLPPGSPPISHDSPPTPEPQRPLTSRSSTPRSSMLNGNEMIKYLQKHHFGIAIRPIHSGIEGGLLSGCKPATKALRVVFVENPESRIPEVSSSRPLSFLTKTSLDKRVYDRLKEGLPKCVKEIPKKSGKGKQKKDENKIDCFISSWVS